MTNQVINELVECLSLSLEHINDGNLSMRIFLALAKAREGLKNDLQANS